MPLAASSPLNIPPRGGGDCLGWGRDGNEIPSYFRAALLIVREEVMSTNTLNEYIFHQLKLY